MFSQLSNRFTEIFKHLSGNSQLSEKNVQSAVKAVQQALIEADVAIEVIEPFIQKVQTYALGAKVVGQLKT